MAKDKQIIYCRCLHYRRTDDNVSDKVMSLLGDSGESFDAVSDLCVTAERSKESLAEWAQAKDLRIAACSQRAVKCLFAAAGVELGDDAVIADMKTSSAKEVASILLDSVEGQDDI